MEKISRQDAIKKGESHYFTGIECKRGHIDIRYVKNCACMSCIREKCLIRSRLDHVKEQNKANKKKQSYKDQQKEYNKKPEVAARRRELSNTHEQLIKKKEYREKTKDKFKLYIKEYYIKNKDILIKKQKEYASRPENKEKRTKYIREWQRKFLDTDIGKASSAMRKFVSRIAFCKNGIRTSDVLGYTKEEFIKHIERQFIKGMSWENFGKWHIDHITPISYFLKNGEKNPKVINALPNLQPIWAKDNLSKHAKITKLV